VTLDRLLVRLHANKEKLLVVLDRPELSLHTNGSERDLRPQVIKRKSSGGTRADLGRACRDAFLGQLLTCAKPGLPFWDYLGTTSAYPTPRRLTCPTSSGSAQPTPERPAFCPSCKPLSVL
jgi:Transposase IS66 family